METNQLREYHELFTQAQNGDIEALDALKNRADSGDITARSILARLVILNHIDIPNIDSDAAFQILQEGIAAKDYIASLTYGIMLLNGTMVEKDLDRAQEYLLVAREAGDLESLFFLGLIAYWKKRFEESAHWLQQAVEAESPSAMYYLGMQYFNGWGLEKDHKKAYELFAGASVSDDRAIGMQAICLYYGLGTEEDEQKAFDLCRDYSLFQMNSVMSYLSDGSEGNLGKSLCLAGSVFQNRGLSLSTVKQVYERSLQSGFQDAKFFIGQILMRDTNAWDDAARYLYEVIQTGSPLSRSSAEQLKVLADKGHPLSQFRFAQTVLFDGKNYCSKEEALKYLKAAAEQGFISANWQLAICYERGAIVEKNLDQAIKHYMAASDAGVGECSNKLADIFFIQGNYDRSKEYAEKAVSQDILKANTYIGYYYYSIQDFEKALPYLLKGYEAGDNSAVDLISSCYLDKKDYAKALDFALLAEKNITPYEGLYRRIGDLYAKRPELQDIDKAKKYYLLGSDMGSSYCSKELALLCSDEDNRSEWLKYAERAYNQGDKKDGATMIGIHYHLESEDEKAIPYLLEGSNAGNGAASNALAELYSLRRDYPNSYKYAKLAVEQNYLHAHYLLGICYQVFWKNQEQALYHYQQASNAGDYRASQRLSAFSEKAKKYKEAFDYAQLSVEQGGDPLMLGFYYLDGIGTKEDAGKAFSLFSKDGGKTPNLRCMMGYCYRDGIGVTKDKQKGEQLIMEAYKAGSTIAASFVDKDGTLRPVKRWFMNKEGGEMIGNILNTVINIVIDESYSD